MNKSHISISSDAILFMGSGKPKEYKVSVCSAKIVRWDIWNIIWKGKKKRLSKTYEKT